MSPLSAQNWQPHWQPQNPPLPSELQKQLRALPQSDSTPKTAERSARLLLQQNAYWLAEFEISEDSLLINPGSALHWGELTLRYQDSTALPQYGRVAPRGTLEPQKLALYFENLIHFYEERGYPFVELQVDEYQVKQDSLFGTVLLLAGPQIKIDSIAVMGYDKIGSALLRYDLGLLLGQVYRESRINEIERRLQRLEHIRPTRKPAVAFFADKTTLYLYLEEVRANRIDGVVGLNTETQGETTINGDFQLRLLNTFKRGEDLELRWRRPDASVQQFALKLHFPYLFKTPLGMAGSIDIFRQDSSFVQSNFKASLPYRLSAGSVISGGIQFRQSNVLNSSVALNSANFSSLLYRLGTHIIRTNRRIVATKGYELEVQGFTGNRQSAEGRQAQYGYEWNAAHYWSVSNRIILKSHGHSALLVGDGLFENEMYRIGGLHSLRGFNEQSLFVSGYLVSGLELRYMVGVNDYLAIFSDFAWIEKKAAAEYQRDFLTGLGAGFNFETQGGIFSFFLAVGQSENEAFDLRTTKVHVGYVNQF